MKLLALAAAALELACAAEPPAPRWIQPGERWWGGGPCVGRVVAEMPGAVTVACEDGRRITL